MTDAVATNYRSVDCYRAVFSEQDHQELVSTAKSCAVVREVSAAIRQGKESQAFALLRPLASNGSLPALRLLLQLEGGPPEYSEAVANWEEVRTIEGLIEFAKMTTRRGNLELAEDAYRLAWLLEPTTTTSFLAGFLVEHLRDTRSAADVWRRALTDFPEAFSDSERQLVAARIFSGYGELEEAVKEYQQFIGENPDIELARSAYSELAWAYRRMGKMPEAVSAIEQALLLDSPWPKTWQIHQRAGAIYEVAGYPAKAISAYRLALSMNESATDAKAALSRLEDVPKNSKGDDQ